VVGTLLLSAFACRVHIVLSLCPGAPLRSNSDISTTFTMAAIFDNKWRSSDPGGSEAMTIRMVITYTVITIRLYCRIAKSPNKPLRERLGWDDVFILLALFTSTIGQAVVFWGKLPCSCLASLF
jgi:hypothetical protein